ncbi:MAG: hypothetical protein M3338_02940 [Actinomycetota bacterium]|nr:hypothetical protein [Actinomycetota bacterium]
MPSTNGQGWQRRRGEDPVLPEVLHVLWERRLLVIGVVLVLVLVSAVFGLREQRFYTVEATVSFQPREGSRAGENPEAFVEGVIGAVTARGFLRDVMREADWTDGLEKFGDRLDVERYDGANGASGLRVLFSGANAVEATRSANAYADVFVARVEQLNDRRLAGGTLAAEASVEEYASPESWASPRPFVLAAAAIVAGVIVGGAAALLLESRARSWRNARDAELTLRAPVLGVIPDYSSEEG